MWTLQFHFNNSVFSKLNPHFWNPNISWSNKWKLIYGQIAITNKGKEIPKFWGSSTFFVALTDAFHLFQFIFLNSLILALSLMADGKVVYSFPIQWWEVFIGIRLIYALVFEGLFGWLLIKK
jgi:hypothetical protein